MGDYDDLLAAFGTVRRLAVAYSRGRLLPEQEAIIEKKLSLRELQTFALLGLVDDRQSPAGAWKV